MAGRPIHIVDICTGFSFVIVLNYFCTPSGVSVHSTGIDDKACTSMKEKCERAQHICFPVLTYVHLFFLNVCYGYSP